jgi:predicted SprT family Zn-dependent metalloprotease
VRRLIQIAVSLSCPGIIFGGMTNARGRELPRQTDPHQVYEQINRKSFDGELPDVPVVWGDLTGDYGVTLFYPDGSVKIVIDRQSVTSEHQLRETLSHESCHVLTHYLVQQAGQDAHGEAFQVCMQRFKYCTGRDVSSDHPGL